MRLGVVRQREKALRHRERFVGLLLRNAVIDELEEADLGRRLPKLICDLGFARFETPHIDARHVARFGCADAAQSLLLVELDEVVGGVVAHGHEVCSPRDCRQRPYRRASSFVRQFARRLRGSDDRWMTSSKA